MAKTIRYPNGMILKGVETSVGLLRNVKRSAMGAVVFTAAPNPAKTTSPATPGTTAKISPTLGLTGVRGACGRSFFRGVVQAKGAGCSKIGVSIKTINATQAVTKLTTTPAATITLTGTNTLPLPIKAPGTVLVKATAGTTVATLAAKSMSVNALTSQMM